MLVLTADEIFTRVYRQLRENGANPIHWTEVELFEYLNDMLLEVAEGAHCFKKTAGIEIKANQRRYQVPADILVPTRMEYDGEFLEACSVEDLDEMDDQWRQRSGTVYTWFVELAPAGYIDLYRVPDDDGDAATLSSDYGLITGISDTAGNTYTFSSNYGVITAIVSDGDDLFEFNSEYGVVTDYFSSSGNLLVHGYGYPDTLDNKNDVLPRPIHGNHLLAVSYLLYRCFSKDGKGQDAEKAGLFRQQFGAKMNELRTKPRTATRRRFQRREQALGYVKVIGPAVPSVIS